MGQIILGAQELRDKLESIKVDYPALHDLLTIKPQGNPELVMLKHQVVESVAFSQAAHKLAVQDDQRMKKGVSPDAIDVSTANWFKDRSNTKELVEKYVNAIGGKNPAVEADLKKLDDALKFDKDVFKKVESANEKIDGEGKALFRSGGRASLDNKTQKAAILTDVGNEFKSAPNAAAVNAANATKNIKA